MDASTAAIIGGVVGFITILGRVIEKLVDGVLAKKAHARAPEPAPPPPAICEFGAQEKERLGDLHRLHERYDDDGIPMVYSPRSWLSAVDKLTERVERITGDQRKICELLERVEQRIENRCPLEDVIERHGARTITASSKKRKRE